MSIKLTTMASMASSTTNVQTSPTPSMKKYSNVGYHYGQYEVPKADECVHLGVGQPRNDELPLKEFNETLMELATSKNPAMLQYGNIPGYTEMRESLSTYLRTLSDTKVTANQLFVTNGITGAINMLTTTFGRAGATVFAEDPTYFIALKIFEERKMKTKSVPIESDGIDVDNLEKQLKEVPKNERCFLYTIPIHNNPTGYSISVEKRAKLMDLLDRYPNLVVIADEVYQHLSFDEESKYLPYADSHQNCISIGSTSKSFAPSVRFGWIHAHPKFICDLANSAHLDSSGCINPFGAIVTHRLIESGRSEQVRKRWMKYLSTNCTKLYDEIVKNLSDYVEVEKPTGGYFLWLRLKKQKPGVKFMARDLARLASRFKVKFHSGEKFSSVQASEDRIRLSFSWYGGDDFATAVMRMKKLFEYYYKDVTQVNVLGATGRLGSLITEQIEESKDYRLGSTLKRKFDLSKNQADGTIIDVSLPDGTDELFTQLLNNDYKVPVVVGTTGLSKDTINKMKLYSKNAPVALVSNFSLGIPQFYKLMNALDKGKWTAKLEEWHHVHKKDAPSGTARSIKEAYDNEVVISSYREGEIVGDHKLTLDSEFESISIMHHAKDRNLFASGALRWVYWLSNQKPGFYTKMTNSVTVEKWSGAGNTFAVVDDKYESYDEETMKTLTKKFCSSSTGVGADGAIFIGPWKEFTSEKKVIVARVWRYFNRDGTHVAMCGNGARVTANWVYNKEGNDSFCLANIAENTVITVVRKTSGGEFEVAMDIGDLDERDESSHVFNVSVPHYVTNTRNLDSRLREMAMEKVDGTERCKLMNVTGYVITSEKEQGQSKEYNVKAATFERGVEDITPACGTGCCAIATSLLLNSFKDDIKVYCTVPSGDILTVNIKLLGGYPHRFGEYGEVYCSLSGPSEKLFEVEL